MTKVLARVGTPADYRKRCGPGFDPHAHAGVLRPEVQADYEKQIPVGRVGEPQDVADAVLFFASEESNYITGQTLPITGGWF